MAASTANDRELRERICVAALTCVARWGITKTTLEDVAREAGCGRATIYRTFAGGKRHVLAAVLAREAGRFRAEIETAIAGAEAEEDLEEVLVAGVVAAARFLAGHDALAYLLAHEPDVVLPHVGFHRLGALFELVGQFAAPHLARFLPEGDDARRASEWLSRVVLTYVLQPSAGVDLTDPASARRLLSAFVVPGLRPATTRIGPMEEQCPATPT